MRSFALLLVLLMTPVALAQCGPGGCSGGSCSGGSCGGGGMVMPIYPDYHWQTHPGDEDSISLYDGNTQIGAYRVTTGEYWNISGNQFTGKGTPPYPVPITAKPKIKPVSSIDPNTSTNFGIDIVKLSVRPSQPCSINGRPASFEQALNAIKFPDDSGKLHVTVNGTPEFNAAVRKQLTDAGLIDKVHFQEYAPDSPMMKSQGFQPGVTMQNSRNEVVHRQDGSENVAEAVRRIHPDYDPKKDPNVTAPTIVDPMEYLKQIYNMLPPVAWLGIAALAYYLHSQKVKTK